MKLMCFVIIVTLALSTWAMPQIGGVTGGGPNDGTTTPFGNRRPTTVVTVSVEPKSTARKIKLVLNQKNR